METGMARLRHVAKRRKFDEFWPDVDKSRWPWREFFWVWCHPVISVMILLGVIAELTILVVFY